MTKPKTEAASGQYGRALTRGALFNLLGSVGKLGYVLFLFAITRLSGSGVAGVYLLAHAMLEVVSSVVVDAPADALLVFASRHAEKARDDAAAQAHLYRVLGTSVRIALVLATLVAILNFFGGRLLVERLFPEYRSLVPGIFFLGCALIPRALSQTTIAATKAMLHMEHDALLNGFLYPLSLLASAVGVYGFGGGLTGLLAAQLVADVVLAVFAFRVFSRYFSLRRLMGAVFSGRADGGVLGFVIPQGFNLTFNRYIARLDSIMLAAFGLGKSELAYFGTAALLTGNLAQIRMIFSGAVAPVVARFHSRGERAALEETIGRIARWTTSLVVPVILVLLVFRGDVMRLLSPDYGSNSLFVAILLIPPFANCAYGLAGACLMFTGHTRVTLVNSLVIAVVNTGFMYLLIPRFGLVGAAIATAAASSIMTVLQMVELASVEKVAIRWRAVSTPHWGFLFALIPIALNWDPATTLVLPQKFAIAGASCAIYVLVLLMLRHEEACRFLRRVRARLGGGTASSPPPGSPPSSSASPSPSSSPSPPASVAPPASAASAGNRFSPAATVVDVTHRL